MSLNRSTVQLLKFAFKKHPLIPEQSSEHFKRSIFGRYLHSSQIRFNNNSLERRKFSNYKELEKLEKFLIKCTYATKASDQDKSKSYDRNYISEKRAIEEYLLETGDLKGLRMTLRRSASEDDPPHKVYWRQDIEARAVAKWGSLEKVQLEKDVRDSNMEEAKFPVYKKYLLERYREKQKRREEKYSRENWPVRQLRFAKKDTEKGLTGESGMVVLGAIAINTSNFFVKMIAWAFTGSHSMFSEAIHSLADTVNQLILAYGIHKSNSTPDKRHPYGYSNVQYVSALISGVGIFCMGAGLSVYHGITGLVSPGSLESIWIAMGILGVSFVSESITLGLAVRSIKRSAAEQNMGFTEFVLSGYDPCVNVVLLEDAAAVAGVVIAASCMGLSHMSGSHIPDAAGSIIIGGLLAAVASFMISSNSGALVGRSISADRLMEINRELEGDIMVRQVYDVKGIDMGNGLVRYKAEIDFDGRELARSYLARQQLSVILAEVRQIKTENEMEQFLLKHGEQMVDCLGAEVDRIEKILKGKHPEVRHVDLEVL